MRFRKHIFDFSIPKELHSFDEDDLEEIEVMITPGSRLIGRKYDCFLKLAFEELNLLGLWRKGSKYRTRLTRETFKAGDVLLLGVRDLAEEDVSNKIKHLGLMPLRQRELQTIPSRSRLIKGLVFFALSIFLVSFNYLSPAIAILIVTMATTDIINNAATAVIMAPISTGIAIELGYAIEPFLMVVAVGASCAFLTPIGHQCNTVVMGPGNYKFTDYWRMGLPMDILIILATIPMILFVWT